MIKHTKYASIKPSVTMYLNLKKMLWARLPSLPSLEDASECLLIMAVHIRVRKTIF